MADPVQPDERQQRRLDVSSSTPTATDETADAFDSEPKVALRRSMTEPLILSLPQHLTEEPPATESERFRHWYPDWNTWKFRRTLSYWISIMYCEGSLLFTVGAAFSICQLSNHGVSQALVDVP